MLVSSNRKSFVSIAPASHNDFTYLRLALNTIPVAEAGAIPILLTVISYTQPSETRKDAVRALTYIAENGPISPPSEPSASYASLSIAVLRETIVDELKNFTLPLPNIVTKIQHHPIDTDEKTLFLDFLRCLDVVKDYVKPGKVFYDVSDFPWIKSVEDAYSAIKKEFMQLDLAKNLVRLTLPLSLLKVFFFFD